MFLHLMRIATNAESTIGTLALDGKFFCWTIEDAFKAQKEAGTTRIPPGLYEIKLRQEGGMTKRYYDRFPDMHQGMLWLQDVPEFSWVYIHTGNKASHSEGCILVGDSANNNAIGDGFVGASTAAYKRLYPQIAEAVVDKDPVKILISDIG
jgi:hypothetical protein